MPRWLGTLLVLVALVGVGVLVLVGVVGVQLANSASKVSINPCTR
jgi:hypothetical protein